MRTLILGGTGAIGGATAARLARDGWQVTVTGRDVDAMPAELTSAGVRFEAVDRADTAAIERLVGDPFSREGYSRCKVAVEVDVLRSGLPVTVIRPSKVHGRWARNARTRAVIEAMRAHPDRLDVGAPHVTDHLTAARNAAELIATIATRPSGVLNVADPDTPTSMEIFARIAELIGWSGELLPGTADSTPQPWRTPMTLDMSAASALGYRPVGTGLELLADEVTWLLEQGI